MKIILTIKYCLTWMKNKILAANIWMAIFVMKIKKKMKIFNILIKIIVLKVIFRVLIPLVWKEYKLIFKFLILKLNHKNNKLKIKIIIIILIITISMLKIKANYKRYLKNSNKSQYLICI
jgi:hypothetical protein